MSNTNWDCSVCGKPVEEHTTELAKAHYERLITPAVGESMDRSEAVRTIREGIVGVSVEKLLAAEAALGWLVEYCEQVEKGLRVALVVVDNCCGCIYKSDEDGRYYTLRGHDPLPEIDAALGSSVAAKGETP